MIEFAAAKYVEPTPASLEETRTLAGVVSRAYQMYHASRAQRKSTRQAMRMLNDALDSQNWGRLAMPQVFVAYSGTKRLEDQASEAHTKLIESIRKVIGRFSNVLKPVYWEDITEAGNINAQVIREIGDSEFGICYFSEPAEGGGFIDNSNVLFEAGMMQALTNAGGILRGWIPIREMESPQLPFDVAEERFLIVERGEDDALNVDEFSKTLHSRIEALVKLLDNGK